MTCEYCGRPTSDGSCGYYECSIRREERAKVEAEWQERYDRAVAHSTECESRMFSEVAKVEAEHAARYAKAMEVLRESPVAALRGDWAERRYAILREHDAATKGGGT